MARMEDRLEAIYVVFGRLVISARKCALFDEVEVAEILPRP